MMIAIAIMAVAFGIERTLVDFLRPIQRFHYGSDGIYNFDPPPWWAMIAMPVGLGAMAFARYPFLPVAPDPPEPE